MSSPELNLDVKQLMEIYFDHSVLNTEINSFVKFHQENPASFDQEPSLIHIYNLLNELNQTRLPNLKSQFENIQFIEELKNLRASTCDKIDRIVEDFEEKEKQARMKEIERMKKFENELEKRKNTKSQTN